MAVAFVEAVSNRPVSKGQRVVSSSVPNENAMRYGFSVTVSGLPADRRHSFCASPPAPDRLRPNG